MCSPTVYLFTKKVRVTSHKSELCSHYKTWFEWGDPSTADSQVVAAVLTELFIFCTTHGNVEIFITVCTCFVQSFFCPLSLLSQLALSPATWVEGRALVRWRRWRRGSKRGWWIYALFHGILRSWGWTPLCWRPREGRQRGSPIRSFFCLCVCHH